MLHRISLIGIIALVTINLISALRVIVSVAPYSYANRCQFCVRFGRSVVHLTPDSLPADYYIGTGTVLAVVLVLVLVLAVMLVGAVLYRRKRRKAGAADRVSFENPSYLREMNLENLQVPPARGRRRGLESMCAPVTLTLAVW